MEGRSQGDASREFQFLTGGTDSLGKTDILEKSSLENGRHLTLDSGSPNNGLPFGSLNIVISGAFWTAAFRKRGMEACVR